MNLGNNHFCLEFTYWRLLTIIEPKELKNVESVELGKTYEKYAIEGFMKIEGKKHQNPKLITCGLYLFKSHPYFVATPDNILKCVCCLKSVAQNHTIQMPHQIQN